MKVLARATSALLVALALLMPFAARAASPTSVGLAPGSGVLACVFSVTGALLAPCTVMVDPTTGATIVTANGSSASSALGVQGVTGGVAVPITGSVGTITQTLVTLPAATSTQLIAANSTRKGLRWMNVGANPMTAVPGSSAAVAGSGMNYNGNAGVGTQGGGDTFEGSSIPTSAFQAISTIGTTVVVWETN